MNILCAATAAACLFQSELRFELAGHDDAGLSCFTDIRISNSLAEAEVHGLYSVIVKQGSCAPLTIMITVINQGKNTPLPSFCQEGRGV